MEELLKRVVVPVDGSDTSLKTMDYLKLIYGSQHHLEIVLLYVLPALPSMFFDMEKTGVLRKKYKAAEQKAQEEAQKVLEKAKARALKLGFKEELLIPEVRSKRETVYKEICRLAGYMRVDSVAITRKGKSWIEAFYAGEVSANLLESCQHYPVWILDGTISSKKVLVCLDHSENSFRAVDHVGFMLSGIDCEITLFHTAWHLGRFMPDEVLACEPDLCTIWDNVQDKEVRQMVKRARDMLLEGGVEESRINVKLKEKSNDPADDIIKMLEKGDYGTVVMGRRGISRIKEFFAGSVTKKVFRNAQNVAIWVVH